jgi:hypothetical protein
MPNQVERRRITLVVVSWVCILGDDYSAVTPDSVRLTPWARPGWAYDCIHTCTHGPQRPADNLSGAKCLGLRDVLGRACKRKHRGSAKEPIFCLTSLSGLLYLGAAGMTALVIAAAMSEETTDEGAYESLACVRSASPACTPRPISIAQQAQLLNRLTSHGREACSPQLCRPRKRYPDGYIIHARRPGQAQPLLPSTQNR